MLKGFKEFISRGNVIDVAVGFVAGAAFTALVTGITDAIINPVVGLVLGGGVDAGTFTVNDQVFNITAVINAIIIFILTMAVLYFVFVAPLNRWRNRTPKPDEPQPITETDLLTEIRDLLKERNP